MIQDAHQGWSGKAHTPTAMMTGTQNQTASVEHTRQLMCAVCAEISNKDKSGHPPLCCSRGCCVYGLLMCLLHVGCPFGMPCGVSIFPCLHSLWPPFDPLFTPFLSPGGVLNHGINSGFCCTHVLCQGPYVGLWVCGGAYQEWLLYEHHAAGGSQGRGWAY